MSDKTYRHERIERLLDELQYEITRGMMEGEVPEELGFRFFVPISRKLPDGVVFCQFRTRPVHRIEMCAISPDEIGKARLRVVR